MITVQFDLDELEPLGVGSNSKVYSCTYQGKHCVVKVPHNKDMFSSSLFQVDSINNILGNVEQRDFYLPCVVDFFGADDKWGELFFMEKMEKIYPLYFLLNTGMSDSRYVVTRAAEAIATLHNASISGYDVEFYWSYDLEKLVLLDIGPRYTINADAHEMIYQHFMLAKHSNNHMAIWNIASELLDSSLSTQLFNDIITGKLYPSVDDLIESIEDDSSYQHVSSVAQNHYLQIVGCCDNSIKQELVDIFIKRYLKVANNPNMIYIQAFRNSLYSRIRSSKSCLYYSKYNAISKMSNSVEISDNI